jgi:hypothetical protein
MEILRPFFFEFEMCRLNGGKTRKMENRFMQIAPTTKRDINLHDSTFLKDFFLRNIPSWNLSTADRVCPCYIQLQPNVNAGEPKHFTGLVMQPKENGIFAIYSPKSRGKASFFCFFCTRVQLERTENPESYGSVCSFRQRTVIIHSTLQSSSLFFFSSLCNKMKKRIFGITPILLMKQRG